MTLPDCCPSALAQLEADAQATFDAITPESFEAERAAHEAAFANLPMLLDMPAAKYHADPCPRPSLSASIAHTLTSKSCLHAWLRHPKLGRQRGESTPETDKGTLIHALVLGQQPDLEIVHADNWRKGKAQDRRDEAHAEGRTPILAREYEDALEVVKSLDVDLARHGIELNTPTSRREQVVIWEEQTAAGPVLCRGRIDHLDAPEIIDLKTIRDSHPDTCTRSVMQHGYHLQAEAYKSAVRQLYPDLAGRESFRWLFAEILPPGSPRRVVLTVARPSGAMKELGRSLWARACLRWAECLRDHWFPGYCEGEVPLEPPAWAMREEYEVGSNG